MPPAPRRLPFRYLEPACFSGLLDDPLLFLRIRPEGRALLFDCGQIAHLAKRVVKPIDAVFISHAHMDHIMGLPTLVRHRHASPRPLDVYGPEGIIERVDHLLHGYAWNLCEPTWFTLRVHEILPERIVHCRFPGPACFARHDDGEEPRRSSTIWSSCYARVAAEILDHKIPVLAFRVDERPPFSVDPARLEAEGLLAGEWIRDLKTRIWKGRGEEPIIASRWVGGKIRREIVPDPSALYALIRGREAAVSLGYVTDVGWTPQNIATLERFFSGLTLLCAECTFLAQDLEKARSSYHLCTADLNDLAARLVPRFLLAMHLSKSYLYHTVDLYAELAPPAATSLLRLPNHIVPPPLSVEEVTKWLRPGIRMECSLCR